ncbi:MAG TPA: hypothetical protein DCE41_06405 [Cytophagales bacterium]|nr:hypothetical protein [Cytophagales bacterium]HAP63179.1 hypothetical protein [Cytophagales bacterium]
MEERLQGGHPNSLGNTVAVVEEVLSTPDPLLADFFHLYYSEDEVVRLRVSNGMKRIAAANKPLLLPYLDRLLTDIAAIDQASTQWTLAQLFKTYEKDLSPEQRTRALEIMQGNVANHTDWIVLAQTMDTLGKWAKKDESLKAWLLPHLARHAQDERKSVASKAKKIIASLS